jgi:hypothetical protein
MRPTAAPKDFQVCGSCRSSWPTWDGFVLDPAVRLVGLQVVAGHPNLNLLVFEHRCGSSISILTPRVRHILPDDGDHEQRAVLMGTESCRGHCVRLEDLERCDAPCANARDRELILLVQRMKEARASARHQCVR